MSKVHHERPSEEEFLVQIKTHQSGIANCECQQNSVITKGQKTYKVASVLQFRNPATNQITHRELHLNDYRFRRGTGIQWEVKDRLRHWTCKDDEIERLKAFLHGIDEALEPKEYTVVEGRANARTQEFLRFLENVNAKNLGGLIDALAERAEELQTLPPLGESDNRRMVASALRASHRSVALKRLTELITTNAHERLFQQLLDRNWWMLGGQYVEKIPKRDWTNEENLDMMLKSADNGYDIVELKRSDASLFKTHRNKLIVSSDVNDAVNQAAHYISEIERQRDHFIARYNVDLYKVRAKVLIGTITESEGDADAKRLALRMYNSHLHQIEVMTFDGIARICDQVINANLGESTHSGRPVEPVDDVPF
jgi:Domain of unknown function (DUF4263)